jgi:hypothetical protein
MDFIKHENAPPSAKRRYASRLQSVFDGLDCPVLAAFQLVEIQDRPSRQSFEIYARLAPAAAIAVKRLLAQDGTRIGEAR